MPDVVELERLLSYQEIGAAWLSRTPQALLADSMGLGKTGQAVVACDLVGARRICVVCPAAARPNWRREFERFSPMDRAFDILDGESSPSTSPGVRCCSFDFCSDPRQLRVLLDSGPFDVLILDEVHYLKAKDATRTRAIYRFLAPTALHVWRLSGTPSPNGRPDEMWPHLASAGVTTLALPQFIARYCNGYEGARGFRVTGPKQSTLPELRSLIAQMTLRRTVAEVAPELPEVRHELIHVDAAPVDEELWFADQCVSPTARAHFRETLKNANDQLRALFSNTTASAARQGIIDSLSNSVPMSTLRRYIGLSKVPPVVEILRGQLRHNKEMKVVIFAAHRDVIALLRDELKEFGAVFFFGGMAAAKREANRKAFATSPKCRVFIGHIQAAGTAIDGLQNQCREVVIIEPSWVPGENAQAVMRVHRRGVSGPVRVRWYCVDGSVDSQINDSLRKKVDAQMKIFD